MRTILFGALVVAAALLLWTLAEVLLLVFAAVLLAIGLAGAAGWVSRHAGMDYGWSLGLVAVSLICLVAAAGYFFGASISAEIEQIIATIPEGLSRLRRAAERIPWASAFLDRPQLDVAAIGRGLVPRAVGAVTTFIGTVLGAFVVVVAAIYFAADSNMYLQGVLKLAPTDVRGDFERFFGLTGEKLKRWFLGQLTLMVIVGVLVGVALTLLGVPYAAALGLLAGLIEFVPFFGPLISGAVAVLVAVVVSPALAGWTFAAFVVIQQIENQILVPIIQRKAASLPPVVSIFAAIGFGAVFGVLGIVLAAPLAVLTIAAVQVFYLREGAADSPLRARTAKPAA